MIRPPLRNLPLLLLLAANPWFARDACASLGGESSSVATDAAGMHGEDRVTSLQTCDIHEITTDGGMHIREFVDRRGAVFAVTWSGPVVPDLRQLLGASFSAYATALASLAQRPLHRFTRIATPELVVENGGHMRAFSGRAYLPARLPAGVPPADIH